MKNPTTTKTNEWANKHKNKQKIEQVEQTGKDDESNLCSRGKTWQLKMLNLNPLERFCDVEVKAGIIMYFSKVKKWVKGLLHDNVTHSWRHELLQMIYWVVL